MKLLALLLLLPISASAQGNARCPLNLPFRITVEVSGRYAGYMTWSTPNSPAVYDTTSENNYYVFMIDTTNKRSNVSFSGDSIQYTEFDTAMTSGFGFDTTWNGSIHFDTAHGIITTLTLTINTVHQLSDGEYQSAQTFECQNIRYGSDSIFKDGPIPDNNVLVESDDWYQVEHEAPPTNTTVSSGNDLMGGTMQVFGSAKAQSSVAAGSISTFSMLMEFTPSSLHFSFLALDHSRIMELYTPLGIKVGSYEIAAGQSELPLPHLTSGLYFVRMEGAIIKVAVP
jgi:hypothetical protein